ncbi:iron-dependent repressor IdeR [Flavobacteriaceae bacterium UJ101]|nr:iron-dependent repressor IdeR [Flavobacteriaceae bacterium UJ101]
MTNKLNTTNITKSEEDYLKALFHLTSSDLNNKVGNNQLADFLSLSPASVNNMVKKLKSKQWVLSERYGKLELTTEGRAIALNLIRKHRLWETFLYKYMNFTWDEVHEVAEQLEHVKSQKLIDELDRFMGYPKKDPHGDIIPGQDGDYATLKKLKLSELQIHDTCRIVAVNDNSIAFLQYVSKLGLILSSEITVQDVFKFDHTLQIAFDGKVETVSQKFAENVFVELISK